MPALPFARVLFEIRVSLHHGCWKKGRHLGLTQWSFLGRWTERFGLISRKARTSIEAIVNGRHLGISRTYFCLVTAGLFSIVNEKEGGQQSMSNSMVGSKTMGFSNRRYVEFHSLWNVEDLCLETDHHVILSVLCKGLPKLSEAIIISYIYLLSSDLFEPRQLFQFWRRQRNNLVMNFLHALWNFMNFMNWKYFNLWNTFTVLYIWLTCNQKIPQKASITLGSFYCRRDTNFC